MAKDMYVCGMAGSGGGVVCSIRNIECKQFQGNKELI
jgi:hypothetical protein